MLPFNLVTGAVGLAMDMAEQRAQVASHNIAFANRPGATFQRANFASAVSLLDRVASDVPVDGAALAHVDVSQTQSFDGVSLAAGEGLDHEVTELALANAHYQTLAEALTRQFGLMSLAMSGDQG